MIGYSTQVISYISIFLKLSFVFEEKQNDADFPMIVDPIHKMLYCELPKVGSSNWKRVLIKLTDPRKRPINDISIKRKFILKLWYGLESDLKMSETFWPSESRENLNTIILKRLENIR